MVFVDPKIASTVAHMAGVKAAVTVERDKLAAVAEGLFASHDNPGGHSITTSEPHDFASLDAFVNLEGPAPLSVEFGHWTPDHKQHVEGLHILGRTIAQATL
jgi:hypothetical protein